MINNSRIEASMLTGVDDPYARGADRFMIACFWALNPSQNPDDLSGIGLN